MNPPSRQLAFAGWLAGADEAPTADDWYTPPELVALIADFFGGDIDLDPCASPHAFVNARIGYTLADDGLSLPWIGTIHVPLDERERGEAPIAIRNRFLNPPYSNPRPWLERLADLHALFSDVKGAIDPGDSIALVKCDPSTRAWQAAWTADAVLFFGKRVQFVRPNGTLRASAPFPSALLYFGPHAEAFSDWFGELGHVVLKTAEQRIVEHLERERADADTDVNGEIVLIHCTCPTLPCPKHPLQGGHGGEGRGAT